MEGRSSQTPTLAPNLVTGAVDGGRIVDNIIQFVRLLRAAGLAVGPEKTVQATRAVLAAGIESHSVLYWTLHAVFVNRRAEREIFNQAFVIFWRDPGYLDQMLSLMLPKSRDTETPKQPPPLSRRLAESLFHSRGQTAPRERERLELEAFETWSDREILRAKDFEQMSADELRRARAALSRMTLLREEILTRRHEPAHHGGSIDMRRILRQTGARGPDHLQLLRRRRRWRRTPLVILCDISGSMDTYARVLLHFLYALTSDRDRVHVFLFGTRLTDITRTLRNRDADVAITKVGKDVSDWSGGTRIGASLTAFNRHWARRVLGQNATVLLFTDGLDADAGTELERAARRLSASCRRLIWLNPLLRYDGYAPLAAGARILACHAHECRSCHNLASLDDLAAALGRRPSFAGSRDIRRQRVDS